MLVRTPSRLSLHKLAIIAPLCACLLLASASAHAGGGGGKVAAGASEQPAAGASEQVAAGASEQPAASFSIAMKQDIFFGFHGIAHLGVRLTDLMDLTVYSILWTRPGFGAEGTGGNLWTEWGLGVNFKLLGGNLGINPQFGILNGTLLSGGKRGLTFEGIVPNLSANYDDGFLQGNVYLGYYVGLRSQDGSKKNDFLHYWVSAGVSFLKRFSVGAHYEALWQTRGYKDDEVEDLYQWIGPYVEVRALSGFIRFAAGVDVGGEETADFYQITTGLNF